MGTDRSVTLMQLHADLSPVTSVFFW